MQGARPARLASPADLLAGTEREPHRVRESHACAGFAPHSCSAIILCFPSEKFIIGTAGLCVEEPEIGLVFRRSSY